VRALLAQHVAVDTAEADGSTALHWRSSETDVPIVDLLLAAGANVKARRATNTRRCRSRAPTAMPRLVDRRSRPAPMRTRHPKKGRPR